MPSFTQTATLVPRAAAGDPVAFERLVEATADRYLRLAARVMGDQREAEDVVQEAWGKALVSLRAGQFDGRSSVETWIYRIVLRTALNARRARGRRAALNALWTPPQSDSREAMEARVALRELAGLLDELPEEQASALLLKEVEGLTAAEVAHVLECSEGAVEQRLVRARATLQRRTAP